MNVYSDLQAMYRLLPTWRSFIEYVSLGRGRSTVLLAIEAGFSARLALDLKRVYGCTEEDANMFIERANSLAYSTPDVPSTREVASRLAEVVATIDLLTGYLRYAYLTANDSLEDIFFALDEGLGELSSGTPTASQCKQSYRVVTGGNKKEPRPPASLIADQLAVEISILKDVHNEELTPSLARLQKLYDRMVKGV